MLLFKTCTSIKQGLYITKFGMFGALNVLTSMIQTEKLSLKLRVFSFLESKSYVMVMYHLHKLRKKAREWRLKKRRGEKKLPIHYIIFSFPDTTSTVHFRIRGAFASLNPTVWGGKKYLETFPQKLSRVEMFHIVLKN